MSMNSAYWCYSCNRFVRVWTQDLIACPDCNGGFVEEIENATRSSLSNSRRRRFPAAAMYMMRNPESGPGSVSGSGLGSSPRLWRNRRNGGDRSPFNPVIVLRGPNDGRGGATAGGGFALYYDDGAGSGLRPLPDSMSEFLLGSGFDRLLDQLSQIEVNGIGRISSNPPASKAAIESMPTIEINDQHIATESHCAVCKEAFDLGSEGREMPCKHLYHQDCILPWLSLRNSCPVCRHELPTDDDNNDSNYHRDTTSLNRGENEIVNDDETVGLTIWRLPGGGFAVGRFSGGRRGGERELPVVYTEMDGGFNNNGVPRRISWGSNGNDLQERGGLRRILRGFLSCFGRICTPHTQSISFLSFISSISAPPSLSYLLNCRPPSPPPPPPSQGIYCWGLISSQIRCLGTGLCALYPDLPLCYLFLKFWSGFVKHTQGFSSIFAAQLLFWFSTALLWIFLTYTHCAFEFPSGNSSPLDLRTC